MSDTTGTFSNNIRLATIQWFIGDVVGLSTPKPTIAFKTCSFLEMLVPIPVSVVYTENTTLGVMGLYVPSPTISAFSAYSIGGIAASVSMPDVSIVSRFTVGTIEAEIPAAGVSVFSKYTVGTIVIETPVPDAEGFALSTYGSLSLYPESPETFVGSKYTVGTIEIETIVPVVDVESFGTYCELSLYPESPNIDIYSLYTDGWLDIQAPVPDMFAATFSTHNPIHISAAFLKLRIGGMDGTGGVMSFTLETPDVSIIKNENTNWPLITMVASMPELFMSEDF
jgi:hypothetical protein